MSPEERPIEPGASLPLDAHAWHVVEAVVASVTDYAVFVLDPQGHVLTWNAGAERMKGYTRSEILGSHFSRFYPPPEKARRVPDHELEVAAREGRFEDEGWRLRKDGSAFWASVVITAIRDERGALAGYLKITRDLTARRAQEQALAESEERFRLLLEGVADYAIYMIDVDGRVMSWNSGAERIKGYSAHEVLGRNWSMFHPPEAVEAGQPEDIVEQARVVGRAEDEGWRMRRDGTRFWASSILTRLLDGGGRLRGFAEVTRDLTERRRAKALEESGRRTNEFLAMLSHELRNPMAPIRNAVALMAEREVSDPMIAWACEVIERQTQLLGRLVDDLLDISRVTLGKIRLERVGLDLVEVARSAVETVRPLVETHRHRLEVILPPEPLFVLGDGTRLVQAVVNLLTNAAKYTPDGGEVRLTVAQEGSDAVLRVRDTGVGMSRDQIARAFDLFVQGDRSLDRTDGGLGVGLTLSRRLVEMHGGTLLASSDGPGTGTEFTIWLPLAEVEASTSGASAAGAGAPAADSPAGGGACALSGRVLVVDDNEDAAESTAMLLRMWGLEVETAHDGVQGLQLAASFKPRYVMLDLGLPRMDGYEVARRIRQTPGLGENVLLVALTGYGQPEDLEGTRRAGFDHHLTKPVDPELLQRLLLDAGGVPTA